MSAEAQPQLGDKDELLSSVILERASDRRHGSQIARFSKEDNTQLVQLTLGHGELVEVILSVVTKAVDRLVEQAPGAAGTSSVHATAGNGAATR